MQEASATMGTQPPADAAHAGASSARMRTRWRSEIRAHRPAADTVRRRPASSRERELQHALDEQKTRVLSLNKQRGELSVLQRDVDTAQKAYEAVSASACRSRACRA